METPFKLKSLVFVMLLAIATSCTSSEQTAEEGTETGAPDANSTSSLKEAFKDDFLIGAALNYKQIYGKEDSATAIINTHFNTISPENVLKMGPIHPEPDVYNFDPADKYVDFGVDNDMFVVGHALVWHSQVPDWIFVDEEGTRVTKDTLLQRMQNHIETVAGRYKGKIDGWDVVNEALEDDGTLRKSPWLEIIGAEFIEKAFELAQKTDPEAELYYNDYNLWKPEKRDGAVKLVKNLQEKGLKVDGIGMQGHYGLTSPTIDQIEESILAFSDLGVKVMITELDLDILPNPSKRQGADIAQTFEFQEGYNPYKESLPDSIQDQISQRYADLFALFYKHKDKISRVTLWGVADQHSWLNNWPMPGRTSYPLLFDRNYQPKPAVEAIIKATSSK